MKTGRMLELENVAVRKMSSGGKVEAPSALVVALRQNFATSNFLEVEVKSNPDRLRMEKNFEMLHCLESSESL